MSSWVSLLHFKRNSIHGCDLSNEVHHKESNLIRLHPYKWLVSPKEWDAIQVTVCNLPYIPYKVTPYKSLFYTKRVILMVVQGITLQSYEGWPGVTYVYTY